MNIKIYDSELKVMDVFWNEGDMRASRVCEILRKEIGWNPNTTYTIIKKCEQKGYLQRVDPGFWCHTIITREDVRRSEIKLLIDRLFDGSNKTFMAAFIEDKEIFSSKELKDLKSMLEEKDDE